MTPKHSKHCTRHCTPRGLLLGVLLLAAPPALQARTALPAPQLSSNTDIATAGFYRLNWETAEPGDVQLQEADYPDFHDARLRYEGPDDASVISGMRDGTRYYRARIIDNDQASPWSKAVAVTVAHHPLSRAFMFFTLGVVVFVATLLMVIGGTKGGHRDGR